LTIIKKLRERQISPPIPAFSNRLEIKTRHLFVFAITMHKKFHLANTKGKFVCYSNYKI